MNNMNKAANQFREIVAKGADFNDCEYRVGGVCKATTIGKCKEKCRFISVPLSKRYKEKEAVVKAYDALNEEVKKLYARNAALKKAMKEGKGKI